MLSFLEVFKISITFGEISIPYASRWQWSQLKHIFVVFIYNDGLLSFQALKTIGETGSNGNSVISPTVTAHYIFCSKLIEYKMCALDFRNNALPLGEIRGFDKMIAVLLNWQYHCWDPSTVSSAYRVASKDMT